MKIFFYHFKPQLRYCPKKCIFVGQYLIFLGIFKAKKVAFIMFNESTIRCQKKLDITTPLLLLFTMQQL